MQRDNNCLPCFLDDGDRTSCLHLLGDTLLATDVQLHAYVLMDNQVHLLVTPPAIGAIGRICRCWAAKSSLNSTRAISVPARYGKSATDSEAAPFSGYFVRNP